MKPGDRLVVRRAGGAKCAIVNDSGVSAELAGPQQCLLRNREVRTVIHCIDTIKTRLIPHNTMISGQL
jgi:hypothetical protein